MNTPGLDLQAIIDQLPVHLYWKDRHGRIMGCNALQAKTLGFESPQELVGKNMHDLFSKEEADAIVVMDQEVLVRGEPITRHETVTLHGAEWHSLSKKVPLTNKSGEVIGLLGVSIDVTEDYAQQSRQLQVLENIIALMPGHVYWIDKADTIIGCSLSEAQLFGFASQKELIGKNMRDLVSVEDAQPLIDNNLKIIASGKLQTILEIATVAGEKRIFNSSKAPLKNVKGEIDGIVGISFDITEEHRAKQALESFAKTAAQVAHDIRSPLAALSTVIKMVNIPDQQRILLRNAANRINDIANNLLRRYRSPDQAAGTVELWLLASLLESLLSEKRLQFEGGAIEVESLISSEGFTAFMWCDAVELKRMLSNLINNAAEAFSAVGGVITVSLDASDLELNLAVRDNGCGMTAEQLARVGETGVSFKEKGSGLGLAHAKALVASYGGQLQLQSEVGQGTAVSITLPRAAAPDWFVAEMVLTPGETIAIVDDDASVHDAWRQRLAEFVGKVTVQHFNSLQRFESWYRAQAVPVRVLSDYEVLGDVETGLDVLIRLKCGARGTLVTSHSENSEVIQRCQAAQVGLIPKNLLAHIPIRMGEVPVSNTAGAEAAVAWDYVLLDDYRGVREAWELDAARKGRRVCTVATPEALEEILPRLVKTTPIYIDSSLGNEVKGEDVAKHVFAQGFTELYLATGYEPEDFPPMAWIKKVVGKRPPGTSGR